MFKSELRHQHIGNALKAYLYTVSTILTVSLLVCCFSNKKQKEDSTIAKSGIVTGFDEVKIGDILDELGKPFQQKKQKPKTTDIDNASDYIPKEDELISKEEIDSTDKVELLADNSEIIEISSTDIGIPALSGTRLFGSKNGTSNKGLGIKGHGDGLPKIEMVKEPEIMDNPDVFVAADVYPSVDIDALNKSVKYPQKALKLGIEGKVLLNVLISRDGSAIRYKIAHSDNLILNQSAIDAVMNANYSPAMVGDEAVLCWIAVRARCCQSLSNLRCQHVYRLEFLPGLASRWNALTSQQD